MELCGAAIFLVENVRMVCRLRMRLSQLIRKCRVENFSSTGVNNA